MENSALTIAQSSAELTSHSQHARVKFSELCPMTCMTRGDFCAL